MSNNFSQLQNAIKESVELTQARLLSITLDPEFDTSQVLKAYSDHQQADPAVWKFATGDSKQIESLTQAFSLYWQNEGGTISHGLASALIDRGRRVVEIWCGNDWIPDEVLEQLKATAGQR